MRTLHFLALSLTPVLAQAAQVFVELQNPPAIAYWHEGRKGVQSLALARSQLAANQQAQEAFLAEVNRRGVQAQEIYRVSRLLNGVALEVPDESLELLRSMPQVKALRLLRPKKPLLATAGPLVRAPQVWNRAYTGRGVRVGIIDTGVDYLHRDFGGPGSGYSSNDSTKLGDAPFPNAKVVGGWDFAGDNYDAGSDTPSKRTPKPDPDPMDCGGHGTHVAGIVAGFGVTKDGATFPGPFSLATPLADLAVAPGVAPEAQIYALKVFGCSGSTALVAQALEWAADPNGDGNFADHLDIVNLSLGSDWGSNDDPDAEAANNAARAGILVVAAAGNSGDTTFIVSSPAAATAALAVAAAVDSGAVVGAFEVLAPQNLAGSYPASEADFGPDLATLGDRQGLLAQPQPGEELGCEPFSPASAAALAGKIALINRGTCTFKRKVLNAQNAGAIGVLIVRQDDGDPFTMGNDTSITASITIPAQMTVLSVGQRLRDYLSQGVQVRLTARYRNQFLYTNAAREDTVASFSSRGPRGDLVLKPDLTAPGESVFSAANGTGREGVSLSGTSMATPVVAGAAALLKQARPELAAWQLKALLMNGADPWLFGREKGQEPYHRVSRVGAGRINVERSVSTPILLYASESPQAVSLSLGLLEAGQAASGQVKVANLTNRTVNLRLAAQQTQALAGVRLSVVPSGLQLGPGEEGEVTVRVETWQDLGVVRDATQAATQGNWPRFFLTELSAHLYAFEQDELVGVVPVYAVLKPGGNLVAQPSRLQNAGSQASLSLTGDPQPGLTPLVVPLELAYQAAPTGNPRPARLMALGVASDTSSNPTITFGVKTEAPWVSPEDVKVQVFLDTNRDGTADFKLENRRAVDDTDGFSVRVCPLPAGACKDVAPLGGLSPEGLHIPAFASSVMVLAVPGSEVGLSPGSNFQFWVVSSDSFGEATRTPVIPARVGGNAVSFPALSGVAALPAAPGQVLSLSLSSNTAAQVLLLFPHNRSSLQMQVVPVGKGQPVRHLSRRQ